MRIAVLLFLLASCASAPGPVPELSAVEAVSLFGEPLVAPPLSEAVRRDREAQLAAARAAYEADPDDPDAIIWLGRRTAYLGRFNDAIGIFSEGIAKHANDPRFYRHRGHRYITIRKFDFAIADLKRAAMLVQGDEDEIEPDGLPNARNIPTSTLQSNIFYHLGLAYYLDGQLEKALDAYRRCIKVSTHPDMLVATTHWLYMTLRRLGREEEAKGVLEPIRREMDIIENASYHRLLMMYKGEIEPDALLKGDGDGIDLATIGYGVANWHFYNGRRAEAEKLWRRILEGEQWAAFGFIAAEADLNAVQGSRFGVQGSEFKVQGSTRNTLNFEP